MSDHNNTQLSEPELAPCPFCGGKAAWGEGEQKTKYGNEQVYCSDCYAITAPEMLKTEAADNWNVRVSVAQNELQRELAFYFGAHHGTLGHQADALACTVNNCVRVRNLCLSAPEGDRNG